MSERIGDAIPTQKTKTEEQVRSEMLSLASVMIEKAKGATSGIDACDFTNAAVTAFDAASIRATDVPPNGGRRVLSTRAPIDVPPDGGRAPTDVPPNGG